MTYKIQEIKTNWTRPKFIEICCFHYCSMIGIYHYEDIHYLHPTKDTVAVFKIKYK